MKWLVNSLDLNPTKNLSLKIETMVHEKVASPKEDLWIAIQESWNHFDKEDCFELVKSMFERIKAVIKAWKGTIKY